MFIALPVLTLVWGYANSIGATQTLSQLTGLPNMATWTIPGIERVMEARGAVDEVRNEAQRKARQAAVRAARAEVERRYGPEAAALVPRDLTLAEARHFDFTAFERLMTREGLHVPARPDEQGDGASGQKGTPIPFMTTEAYTKARAALSDLDVKGKAAMTGYSRDEYGSEWSDAAGDFAWTGNGCDTRNDVLARDLVAIVFEDGSDCEVASGVVRYERYTGTADYVFDANDDEYATDLDIEHVVALGNVWVTGGQYWSESKRAAVANDPMNLFAADPSSNRQKGDADAATWLPSNKSFRCAYISQQIAVKAKYDLWVTGPEKDAMGRVLASCPS